MGRSSKPLIFLVTDPAMLEWDEVKKLQAQGHVFNDLWGGSAAPGADAIIGPQCWMMNEALRSMFKVMVQGVRDAKYNRGKVKLHEVRNEALEKASEPKADEPDEDVHVS